MKKLVSIFTVMFLLVGLAACGSSSEPEQEKVKITLMQNKVEIIEGLENLADKFNAQNDMYELEILGTPGDNYSAQIQAQFATDPATAPTIFSSSAGTEQAQLLDYMKPLTDHPAASKFTTGKEDATVDGELYGLPLGVEGYGLVYNKTMFDEAGIDVDAIKSVDDLIAAFDKLPAEVTPLAYGKEGWFIFMHPWGWAYADRDAKAIIDGVTADPSTFSEVAEHIDMVNTLGKLLPYTNKALDKYDDQVANFATGQYAMIHQGNWAWGIIQDYDVDFEIGIMPLPQNGTEGINVGISTYWRVNGQASEEQQAGAEAFLEWIFTDETGSTEFVNELGVIPVYEGIDTSSISPLDQAVYEYVAAGKTTPWIWNFTDFPVAVVNDFAIEFEKFYAGNYTEAELLDALEVVYTNAVE